MSWPDVVLILYLSVLAVLSFNGLHRLWMLLAYRRHAPYGELPAPAEWPVVTVQLPVFNERHVVQRLIRAVAELDYPREKLQIQVLDDSTDDTVGLSREVVDELAAQGLDIELLHRTDRTGFKAGALDAGLDRARGELIAIFDADFLPPAGFLKRAVPHLLVDGVGMVQARWGHLNATDSWLTAAQATLLDGHFVIEHTARHAAGHWFNFNGTAGVWRAAAIRDGGGWQHDTLTEDLDLSYRTQLTGWKFRYLVDLVAPAELPPDMAAFKTQQHRWAKGSIQTAKKLLGRIWRSSEPLGTKLEATAHLGANFSYPLVVLLTLLLPWAIVARIAGGSRELLAVDLVLFSAALLPFLGFYGAAIVGSRGGVTSSRLLRLPVVLAIGLGMAVSQTRAVVEGLVGPVGTFVRTPKWGGVSAGSYRAASRGLVGLELLLAAYMGLACAYVVWQGYFASLPFLLLFACGYAAVGLASLRG